MTEDSQWESAFLAAVGDALGRMALLDVNVVDAAAVESRLDEKALCVAMDLRGDPGRRVSVRLPRELAIEWSGALAGLGEDELNEADLSDGVCELLNMVAGASKTTLGESGIEFDLGIPELETESGSEGDGGPQPRVLLSLEAGEFPIEIKVVDR